MLWGGNEDQFKFDLFHSLEMLFLIICGGTFALGHFFTCMLSFLLALIMDWHMTSAHKRLWESTYVDPYSQPDGDQEDAS